MEFATTRDLKKAYTVWNYAINYNLYDEYTEIIATDPESFNSPIYLPHTFRPEMPSFDLEIPFYEHRYWKDECSQSELRVLSYNALLQSLAVRGTESNEYWPHLKHQPAVNKSYRDQILRQELNFYDADLIGIQ